MAGVYTTEIQPLNVNFQKLESDVSVAKNVNNILSKQMSSIERQCSSIEDKDIEPTICRVLQHIGVGITGESI